MERVMLYIQQSRVSIHAAKQFIGYVASTPKTVRQRGAYCRTCFVYAAEVTAQGISYANWIGIHMIIGKVVSVQCRREFLNTITGFGGSRIQHAMFDSNLWISLRPLFCKHVCHIELLKICPNLDGHEKCNSLTWLAYVYPFQSKSTTSTQESLCTIYRFYKADRPTGKF
jgi:hypothetical protein